jgi:hypothetical protein
MSCRFRMRSIQLVLELIPDLTVPGTPWWGFDSKVTMATSTIELVSICQSAEAVSGDAGRYTAVAVARAAAGPLAGAIGRGLVLFPHLHPVLKLVLSLCPMSGGPELFPGLNQGPRPELWLVDGAVSGHLVLHPEVFPDLYLTIWPEILTRPITVANPNLLAYLATTQNVLPKCKRLLQSAIVAYDYGVFFGIKGFHQELTASHCSMTVSACCWAILQDCLHDHGLYSE